MPTVKDEGKMSHILDRWKLTYGRGLTLPRLHRWRRELKLDRIKLWERGFSLMPVGSDYDEVKDKLADIEEVLGHLRREEVCLEKKARIADLRRKGRERALRRRVQA